ncbi:HNH endonuclease [Comamonas badia]|uniref:HNH endonuclease n=1 Tax=Comamonas badia TaxID=265291 RepID=UPI0012EC5A8C|nr:HNH endonuclease [Comamonas badia]
MNEADSLFADASEFALHLRELRNHRLAAKKREETKRISPTTKQKVLIFQKTNGHCHICGGQITGNWVADHVHHHIYGGESAIENYLPAHRICNSARWFYGTEEFQWIMKMGVFFRTQLEEKGNADAINLAEAFMDHERHRVSRRKQSS